MTSINTCLNLICSPMEAAIISRINIKRTIPMFSLADTLEKEKPDALVHAEDISISYYENSVPSFAETELVRLYAHINSSLTHFSIAARAKNSCTYLACKDKVPIAVLLFKKENNKVTVINEMIDIGEIEILRFSNYIFQHFKAISIISFSLIHKRAYRLPFPSQRFDSSEDIVVTLPATPEAYRAGLSSKMRAGIRYRLNKLRRDFPNFRYEVYEGKDICEHKLQEIIDFQKKRITEKNQAYEVGEAERNWIISLAKVSGLVLAITIDGKLCGGVINFRLGDSYFGHTVAHDSRFNEYGIGILCCYLMICENIRRGGKKAHLSGGRYDYKYKLSGVKIDMASLDIYRSYRPYLFSSAAIFKKWAITKAKLAKKELLEMERKNTFIAKNISKIIRFYRNVKRSQGKSS